MHLVRLLSVLSLLLFINPAQAHNVLESTVPKDGAALATAPEKLAVTFNGQVRLVDLTLTNKAGEAQPLAFKRTTEASETFTYPFPALKPGQYQVDWTALGSDGHKLEGSFGFHIKSE